VATDLTRIGEKARKEPGLVFTSLYHHICDVDNLRACYDALDAKKATGEDGVTKEEYGRNLEENLGDLSGRLKRMVIVRGRNDGATSRRRAARRAGRWESAIWRIRSLKRRSNGPLSPSLRPYSRTAATATGLSAASINVWMPWDGRFSRRESLTW